MRTIRLYYPTLGSKQNGNSIAITSTDVVKHLKVLRANKRQYHYEIGDGDGLIAEAELLKLTKDGAQLQLTHIQERAVRKKRFELLLPIIKPTSLENAVRQSVQLDIYTTVRLYFPEMSRLKSKSYSDNKLNRLNKIAISALQQSKAVFIPNIELSSDLNTVIDSYDEKVRLLLPEMGKDKLSLERLSTEVAESQHIALLIGPEAGLSPNELDSVDSKTNNYTFSLGNSVLTTSTASTVFSGLIKSVSLS
jgi:RsmE family RNA methyltransferase